MTFDRITVNNFGSLLSYHAELTQRINILDTYYVSELSVAIEFLLNNQSAQFIPTQWLQNDTMISAVISMNGEKYTVHASPCGEQLLLTATDAKGNDVTDFYRNALSHTLEQDATESFDGQDKSLPLRLCWYRNPKDQDSLDDISGRTARIATTQTFRMHLIQYIRTFQPEAINCKKSYQVTVDPQGKFGIFSPGIPDDICLSETEEKLFLYLCFLNIAEFWTDIEKIRDLHHEKKPLLIQNFLEYLDESTDISGLIARTNKLQRQVIILSSPLDEEQKRSGSVNTMSENKYPEHKKRNLLLSNRISQSSVKDVIESIFEINEDDQRKEELYRDWERTPILLFINSYGGSVYDGLALIDVIKHSKTPVHTICVGSCMSMAFWIWLAGAKRLVGERSTLMFHDLSSFAIDKTEGIKQELNEMLRLQEMLIEDVTVNSLVTEETLRDYILRKAEWYISAEEAILTKLANGYYK